MAGDIKERIKKVLDGFKKGKSIYQILSNKEIKELQEKYSVFLDTIDENGFIAKSEVRIHSLITPRPYLHLMSSVHPRGRGIVGSFWDNCGRGFLCLDSVLAGPITAHHDTSYVPTYPGMDDFRGLYLREEKNASKTSDIWFVIPQPGRDEDKYSEYYCIQGLGYIIIHSVYNDIRSIVRSFVPVEYPLEVWTICFENLSNRDRKLKLFSRVNWSLISHPAKYFDMRVVCKGEVIHKYNTIIAFNKDMGNTHPRSGFMMSNIKFNGWDMTRELFDGIGVFRIFPKAVEEGKCKDSMGDAPMAGMVGVLEHDFVLKRRDKKEIHIIVGASKRDRKDALRDIQKIFRIFVQKNGIEKEYNRLQKKWRGFVEAHSINTPDTEVNRFFNIWSRYQASNMARFTRALDKVGYRDVLQDLVGIVDFDPEYVRQELLRALSYQLEDGRAIRQYSKFPGADHDLRMYMDSPIWIPETLITYLEETGDFSILEEKIGYYNMKKNIVEEKNKESVYKHAMKGILSCWNNRGQKGLCLVEHGDWNDALDGIGHGGRGVSVWLSVALVYAAKRMLKLTEYLKKNRDSRLLEDIIKTMTRNINKYAWDGKYYVYGFDDKGNPIGSARCKEGKIHLNVNTWAIFSGVAQEAGREDIVLDSIRKITTPIGSLLLYPPYTQKSREVGRICDQTAGLFENGSIYTHGQSFLVTALIYMKRGDEAWENLKKILPSSTLPDISTNPPHQVSNFTVGPDHPDFGKNYYSNFTGSVSWFRRAIIKMTGIIPDFEGLRIEPCVPRHFKEFEVRKVFRGTKYFFRFYNPDGCSASIKEVRVNNKVISRNFIPYKPSHKDVIVNITMG